MERRTNEWVLNKIGARLTLRKGIATRKLRFFGHITRRTASIEKQILQGAVE